MKTKNKKTFEMKILTKILQQNRKSWEYKRKDGNIEFDCVMMRFQLTYFKPMFHSIPLKT